VNDEVRPNAAIEAGRKGGHHGRQIRLATSMRTKSLILDSRPRVWKISFRFLLPVATVLFAGFLLSKAYAELLSELQMSIATYAVSLDSPSQTADQY
jgi:hypothetical protein